MIASTTLASCPPNMSRVHFTCPSFTRSSLSFIDLMDVPKNCTYSFQFSTRSALVWFLIAVSTVPVATFIFLSFFVLYRHPFCGYLLSIRYRFLTSIYDTLVNVVAFWFFLSESGVVWFEKAVLIISINRITKAYNFSLLATNLKTPRGGHSGFASAVCSRYRLRLDLSLRLSINCLSEISSPCPFTGNQKGTNAS